MSLHPETQRSLDYNMAMAYRIVDTLTEMDNITVVMTRANADYGGMQINGYLEDVASRRPDKFRMFHSLGQLRYLSLLKECGCLIGNSSSGIVEAPCLGTPVVNVGNRQRGRYMCRNVIQAMNEPSEIRSAVYRALSETSVRKPDFYYGDGQTAERIVTEIKRFLTNERKR